MDKTTPELGKLLDGSQQRDAIHIAVAPVVAGMPLSPGQRIGFIPGTSFVGTMGELIGIVDPFLQTDVSKGQRFWMFLFPGTITSLRHDWTHPVFVSGGGEPEESDPLDLVSRSKKWITEFAAEMSMGYDRLMDAARDFEQDADYTYDNSERYKEVDCDKWPEFWNHYEIVTGKKVADKDTTPFTCSC